MTIVRTVFQVEVFSEGPFSAGGTDNDPFGLNEIAYAITEGDCIGSIEEISSDVVPASKVTSELLRIGNDGSFFESAEDFDQQQRDDDELEAACNPEDDDDDDG